MGHNGNICRYFREKRQEGMLKLHSSKGAKKPDPMTASSEENAIH
jgi:hypothetical protein